MKKYAKLIILSAVLLVLITVITLAMIFDIDLKIFKNLSIAGIQEKKMAVEVLIQKDILEQANNAAAKADLQTSKNAFDVAKEAYENIDESTIEVVQEATKDEKYFIEYLWIVLGNYAATNNVDINIITPGSTQVTETPKEEEGQTETPTETQREPALNANPSQTAPLSGIQITVEGRYADIADFVFDVENDKSLRFKLDNIKMTYSGDNKVKATFDILSLAVLH